MPDAERPPVGSVGWMDLTVPDAPTVRSFYQEVVGWTPSEVDMGGYSDYCMHAPAAGQVISGICHARGTNAGLPAQWIIYITVDNLERSIDRCLELGGSVLAGPKGAGQGRYCVIQDPAGAVCALYEPAAG